MAYDENLAQRVREIMAAEATVTERKMFGGLAFMLGGHMACGILGEDLMLRLGPEGADAALERQARSADGFHGPSDEGHGVRRSSRPERHSTLRLGRQGHRVRLNAPTEEQRPRADHLTRWGQQAEHDTARITFALAQGICLLRAAR